MYEPRNLPQLNEAISALSSMRFSIVHNNKYSKADAESVALARELVEMEQKMSQDLLQFL